MYTIRRNNWLAHYNPYHDALGRFASGMGSGKNTTRARRAKRYDYEQSIRKAAKAHTKSSADYLKQTKRVSKADKRMSRDMRDMITFNAKNPQKAFDSVERSNIERAKANKLADIQRKNKQEVERLIRKAEKDNYYVAREDRYTAKGLDFVSRIQGYRVYDPRIDVINPEELEPRNQLR